MSDFLQSLPVGGGVLVAGLLYAGVSAFVTGPVIGSRTADKIIGWNQQCRAAIISELRAKEPEPAFMPKLDCKSTLGLFGADGQAVCRRHGNPTFDFGLLDQLNSHQRRLNKARQRRLQAAASSAGSRCDCALSVTLEKRRIPFALYAGSSRLVTPHAVKSFKSDLLTALSSPQCVMKG